MTDKPHMVPITDPDEITAIERNGLTDPIGGLIDGTYYAYAWSIERWRKQRLTDSP